MELAPRCLPFYFYPRPPRGGRLRMLSRDSWQCQISIHALREEGDPKISDTTLGRDVISIHALREEGDPTADGVLLSSFDFYPRPPRGGRQLNFREASATCRFLSTPSARRATWQALLDRADPDDFYPRPPRGGRQQKQRQNLYFQTNYTTFCTNLEEP